MTRVELLDDDVLLAIERLSSHKRTAFASDIAGAVLKRRQERRRYRHWLWKALTFRPRPPSEQDILAAAARLRAQGYRVSIKDTRRLAPQPVRLRLIAYNPNA